MELWAWIVAYLVGFTLLQLLLYRYFRRDVPRSETTTPASGELPSARLNGGTDAASATGNVCQHCGAENQPDPTFSFCRECQSPLQ